MPPMTTGMMIMKKKIILPLTNAMQKLGQHFLKNKSISLKIIDELSLSADDIIFETGPGHGELTELLKKSATAISAADKKNRGIKIISIEKDEILYVSLKEQFRDDGQIEIVSGDALKLLPLLISKNHDIETRKYKLVGNIPYYITGHLLRIISELKNKPEICVFMLQREVAERITVQPPKMNRLSASVQFWAEPKIIINVPKTDFRPAPKVDSAVLTLKLKDNFSHRDADDYYAAVRAIFSQPRKTVLNNIFTDISNSKESKVYIYKKDDLISALKKIGVNPESRPQNLSVEDIKNISEVFFKNH